jgi:hypothetical protein
MNCYICKKETTEKSTRYVEPVCLECDEKFLESENKIEAFRKQYRIDHAACPKCGSTSHYSTLAGFVMYADRLDDYKDLNDCTCSSCGDEHTAHERVPVNESK